MCNFTALPYTAHTVTQLKSSKMQVYRNKKYENAQFHESLLINDLFLAAPFNYSVPMSIRFREPQPLQSAKQILIYTRKLGKSVQENFCRQP